MLTQFLIAFAAALAAVMLARLAASRWGRDAQPAQTASLERDLEPIVFLFRDRQLVDATAPARALLTVLPGEGDWQRLLSWLASRMPDAVEPLNDLGRRDRVELASRDAGLSGLRVLAEDLGQGHLRLILTDPMAENAGIVVDSLTLAAMEHELEILRSTMDHSPMLAWRQDEFGHVTWANSAYLQLADVVMQGQTLWPLPRLIQLSPRSEVGQATHGAQRVQIQADRQSRWYECHSHEISDQTVAIALPADAAVRAERSLREFVQTLTKTFADLPIGLAIFDRDRNLQLFNPALIDLTGLATGFLTARPTLYAFLDRLREARMVPEPKDYRSWRQRMNTLETAAASGHHVEMWSLPGGQTYRVTGRPHPDGALAFLFEDITSEISLTRKFRADLSLGAEVLDGLADALAVFAANGELLLSNRGYTELWGGPDRAGVEEQVARWISSCGDSPGLNALCDAVRLPLNAATPSKGLLVGPTGGLLTWSLRSLSGGRLLVSFQLPVSHPARDPALLASVSASAAETRVMPG